VNTFLLSWYWLRYIVLQETINIMSIITLTTLPHSLVYHIYYITTQFSVPHTALPHVCIQQQQCPVSCSMYNGTHLECWCQESTYDNWLPVDSALCGGLSEYNLQEFLYINTSAVPSNTNHWTVDIVYRTIKHSAMDCSNLNMARQWNYSKNLK